MEGDSVNLMYYAVGGASLFILIAVGIAALFIKRKQRHKENEAFKSRKKEEPSPLQETSKKQQISPPQKIEAPQKEEQLPKVELPQKVQETPKVEEPLKIQVTLEVGEAQKIEESKKVEEILKAEEPTKVEQPKEVEPQVENNVKKVAGEEQELQRRQITHKLRGTQQYYVKKIIQSSPVKPNQVVQPNQEVQTSQVVQPNQEVQTSQVVQPNQEVQTTQAVQLNQEIDTNQQVQSTPKVSKIKTLELTFYKVQARRKEENKSFFLDEYLNIGRNEETNDWVISDDATVSGSHCRLFQKDGEVYIVDLNSTNGTYVNDQRISGEKKIENHDKIRMGQSVYRIKI